MTLRYQQNYIQNPHVFGSMKKYSVTPNFHQRAKNPPPSLNNNFMLSRNTGPQSYQSLNLSSSVNQLPNDSKISHARNFKQRLFQADEFLQAKKQFQKMSYRQELQQQMKEDKERKLREKQKIERQELERQRKFYAEVRNIKAQQPKPKQQPSYLIMRSRKGDRNKQKTERNLHSVDQSRSIQGKGKEQAVSELQMPKIMKRGGYHNQSSLDSVNPQIQKQQTTINQSRIQKLQTSRINPYKQRQDQLQEREIEIIRERNYQEERISNIMRLQQKTIKKLEYFKQEIIKSNNKFNSEKQVQQIRNILKSKPIRLQVWGVRNDEIFNNNSDFYAFPSKSGDKRMLTRSKNRQNRSSSINQGIDLNKQEQEGQMIRTLTAQNQQHEQHDQANNNQNEGIMTIEKSKREIKLLRYGNDKNYIENIDEEGQNNPQMSIPVVLRQHENNKKDYRQKQEQNNENNDEEGN